MQLKSIAFTQALILFSYTSFQSASAQVVVFSNLDTSANSSVATGGSGSGISRLLAEKVTLIPGAAGQSITKVDLSVANLNSGSLSVRARVRFWMDNGTAGGPGTLLNAFSFLPPSFGGNSTTTITFSPSAGQLVVPANGTIWAGLQFDNPNGTTASSAQVDNFGMGLYSGTSVGSSDDTYWISTNGSNQASNNPVGSFGSNPVGTNFGWKFEVAAVIPEPSTYALWVGMAALGFVVVRRHVRND